MDIYLSNVAFIKMVKENKRLLSGKNNLIS